MNHDFGPAFAVFIYAFFYSRITTGARSCDGDRTAREGASSIRPCESVVQGRLPPTSVHDPSKREQTTLGSSVKNWRRIRAALNVCKEQGARGLFRSASGLLLVVGAAYLGFMALADNFRPVHRTRIIPADQQQTITPPDRQQAITPSDQKRAITPADQQQATISNRSVHGAPPTMAPRQCARSRPRPPPC